MLAPGRFRLAVLPLLLASCGSKEDAVEATPAAVPDEPSAVVSESDENPAPVAPDEPEPEPESLEDQEGPASVETQVDPALRARLQALGYADTVPDDKNTLPDGLVHREEGSFPGLDLLTAIPLCTTVLLDESGTEVHRWHDPDAARWNRARLLADGDLLVVGAGKEDGRHALFVERWSWGGERRFRVDVGAHHDAQLLDDGRILTLTKSNRTVHAYAGGRKLRDNAVALLAADGALLEEHSLFDLLLRRGHELTLLGPREVEPWSGDVLDPLHANTVRWIASKSIADGVGGQVLVTLRHQNLVTVLDLEAHAVTFTFGPGVLELPHDADLLDDGHLLVFDNGTPERGFSRVVEIDPRSREIVWEYHAAKPADFYSPSRGTVQRLEGGNTLIGDSDSGEAFEVTPSGEEVWRFRNPLRDAHGARTVLRLQRYSAEFVAAARQAGEDR